VPQQLTSQGKGGRSREEAEAHGEAKTNHELILHQAKSHAQGGDSIE
jgi:hypothetical protein